MSMKVYQIKVDSEFQALVPMDLELYISIVTSRGFSGQPLLSRWKQLNCFVDDPQLRRGDFFGFSAGTFAFAEDVNASLREIFVSVGETVPIIYDAKRYELINVLRRIDPIDRQRAIPKMLDGKWIVGFEKYAFIPRKLHCESIFLIQEEPSSLFTVSDHDYPERDFYRKYVELGLRGINFKLVWSEESQQFK